MAINNFNVGVGTTSQLTRYRYVATGGETSISGADADGKTLSYTVGLEQVYLNGVNLVRGQDYTATNGTSVGNLTALVASDVVEVFAFVPFNIANAVTASTVDAKGDLLVGTAADTVGRLAVGTDGNMLVADSTASSGLAWQMPGMVHLNTTSFSASASQSVSSVFSSTYENYLIVVNWTGSNSNQLYMRLRSGTTDESGSNYKYSGFTSITNSTTLTGLNNDSNTVWRIGYTTSTIETAYATVMLWSPQNANRRTEYQANYSWYDNTRFNSGWISGGHLSVAAYDGFTLFQDGASPQITGSVSTYGFRK